MGKENKPNLSRRDFLKGLGAFSAAVIFSACKAEADLLTGTTEPDPTKPYIPEIDPTQPATATADVPATAFAKETEIAGAIAQVREVFWNKQEDLEKWISFGEQTNNAYAGIYKLENKDKEMEAYFAIAPNGEDAGWYLLKDGQWEKLEYKQVKNDQWKWSSGKQTIFVLEEKNGELFNDFIDPETEDKYLIDWREREKKTIKVDNALLIPPEFTDYQIPEEVLEQLPKVWYDRFNPETEARQIEDENGNVLWIKAGAKWEKYIYIPEEIQKVIDEKGLVQNVNGEWVNKYGVVRFYQKEDGEWVDNYQVWIKKAEARIELVDSKRTKGLWSQEGLYPSNGLYSREGRFIVTKALPEIKAVIDGEQVKVLGLTAIIYSPNNRDEIWEVVLPLKVIRADGQEIKMPFVDYIDPYNPFEISMSEFLDRINIGDCIESSVQTKESTSQSLDKVLLDKNNYGAWGYLFFKSFEDWPYYMMTTAELEELDIKLDKFPEDPILSTYNYRIVSYSKD